VLRTRLNDKDKYFSLIVNSTSVSTEAVIAATDLDKDDISVIGISRTGLLRNITQSLPQPDAGDSGNSV